jgi:hypothetical protein
LKSLVRELTKEYGGVFSGLTGGGDVL